MTIKEIDMGKRLEILKCIVFGTFTDPTLRIYLNNQSRKATVLYSGYLFKETPILAWSSKPGFSTQSEYTHVRRAAPWRREIVLPSDP